MKIMRIQSKHITMQAAHTKFLGERIVYPESDGKPMADNTKQAKWIINLYNNIHILLKDEPQVFIAADHFWYPVKGNPNIKVAPDVMVVFGRPAGDRRSYKQWREGGLAPQVVFEILSPSNSTVEMLQKREFYEKYGVEEFIIIDPDQEIFTVYLKKDGRLQLVDLKKDIWQSPRLKMKLIVTDDGLQALHPNGIPFKTAQELEAEAEKHKQAADTERKAKDAALVEIERLKAELKQLKGK